MLYGIILQILKASPETKMMMMMITVTLDCLWTKTNAAVVAVVRPRKTCVIAITTPNYLVWNAASSPVIMASVPRRIAVTDLVSKGVATDARPFTALVVTDPVSKRVAMDVFTAAAVPSVPVELIRNRIEL